jgi:sigma54-dependent transcription regulator
MTNKCTRLKEYKGNLSANIRDMITTKEKAKIEENIKEIAKTDETLKRLHEEYRTIEERQTVVSRQLQKRAQTHKLEYRTYGDRMELAKMLEVCRHCCLVSDKVNSQLQTANDLWALGKRKEAHKVWDTVIKEHQLI